MKKEKTTIEWLVAEDDEAWQRLQEGTAQEQHLPEKPLSKQHHLRRWLYAVLGLFVLLALVGSWLWRKSETGIAQVEGEISVAALGVLPATQQGPSEPLLVDNQIAPASHAIQKSFPGNPQKEFSIVKVELLNLKGDQAVVKLTMASPASPTTYRQTRFYRQTSRGWLQSRPDMALWGWESSLETNHFVFHYRQFDADAVKEVAAQVDALDEALTADFGLANSTAEKRVIKLNVNTVPGAFPSHPVAGPIVLASPAFILAPEGLSDAEILKQAFYLRLIQQRLLEASDRYDIPIDWQPLLTAFILWQLWDTTMPLSQWHEPVVRWVYTNEHVTPQAGISTLPQYEQFCAAHDLWLAIPLQIGIPVTCTESDRQITDRMLWMAEPAVPSHLAELDIPPVVEREQWVEGRFHSAYPSETVAMSTLIDYLVTTYGRQQLPLLLSQLNRYNRWETLLPAVYGVPAAEIEEGWRAYLVNHYGIVLPD